MNRIHIGPLDLYGCREAQERMEPYLDGELARIERRRVAFHLVICRECALLFRFEERLDGRIRLELNQTEAPPEVHGKVQDALKRARESNESNPNV